MTIHWKAVEQYFILELFVFQFYPVGNFGKFIHFVLGTDRSELKAYDFRSAKRQRHLLTESLEEPRSGLLHFISPNEEDFVPCKRLISDITKTEV